MWGDVTGIKIWVKPRETSKEILVPHLVAFQALYEKTALLGLMILMVIIIDTVKVSLYWNAFNILSIQPYIWYPLHSCFGLISHFVIEAAVQNQQRILSRRPSVISQIFKKSTVSFGLITFFALKVLFVDIFITVGDVCTDFWQVRLIGLSNKQLI